MALRNAQLERLTGELDTAIRTRKTIEAAGTERCHYIIKITHCPN